MRRWATGVLVFMAAVLPAIPAAGADAPRSFTLTAGGDILIHRSIAQLADTYAEGPAYDFRPMFAAIEPWVGEADFAICHLEGALDPENTDLSYYPRFNAPHEVAEALAAAGYDACSTAGNHTLDHGFGGLADTLDVLDAAGLRHTGSARGPSERLPNLYEINGITVGHLAYTYSTNGLPPPADKPWAVNTFGSGDEILADAAWAREHGAEFVIVSLHWGAEYQTPPTAGQIALAERLLSSPDVDLILGTHVHVVQPIGRVGDKVVVYGMGNEISNMFNHDGHSGTEDGILVHLRVEEVEGRFVVDQVAYTPTWVNPATKAVLPVVASLPSADGYRPALQASLQRSMARVGLLETPGVDLSPALWPALLCQGRPATILGTAGADVIVGTAGPDVIAARGGADQIDGGSGDDLICGGPGDDRVTGGFGRDVIYGGTGDDRLEGGIGDDRLWGEADADSLDGGEGADLLDGGAGDDRLAGGAGDDVMAAGAGNDFVVAGDGHDVAGGGTGDDLLLGGGGADRLFGGPGDDLLLGGEQDDGLFGGPGDDLIWGGDGNDELQGGGGRDRLTGGPGRDACLSDSSRFCQG